MFCPAVPAANFSAIPSTNKQPHCLQAAAKELFDLEDDAGEKAAALLAYKQAFKEFRDYSLHVAPPAPVHAQAAGGDDM